RIQLILDAADRPEREGRGLEADEKQELSALQADNKSIEARMAQIDSNAEIVAEVDRLTPGRGVHSTMAADSRSWGYQFVANAAGQKLSKDRGHQRAGAWASPFVELRATTLTEDPASGGALVPPQRLPDIVALPQRKIVVADLLAPGTTTSSAITYMA